MPQKSPIVFMLRIIPGIPGILGIPGIVPMSPRSHQCPQCPQGPTNVPSVPHTDGTLMSHDAPKVPHFFIPGIIPGIMGISGIIMGIIMGIIPGILGILGTPGGVETSNVTPEPRQSPSVSPWSHRSDTQCHPDPPSVTRAKCHLPVGTLTPNPPQCLPVSP